MTDSPDFILARIAEVQSQIQVNDLYIQILFEVVVSSLTLVAAQYVLERIKGGFDSNLTQGVQMAAFCVLMLAALASVSLAYDNFTLQVTLDQLTFQYEAVYGPLPERW